MSHTGERFLPQGGHVAPFKPGQAPEGAIFLSEKEILNMQSKIIKSWKPSYEMWSLTHGQALLAGVASVSGAIFTSLLRPQFHLRNFGMLATYLPNLTLPIFSTLVLHNVYVTNEMRMKHLNCTPCAQVKAATIQSLTGFVQPFLLSVLSCSAAAKSFKTYSMPPWRDIPAHVNLVRGMMKPFTRTAAWLFLLNAVLSMGIVRQQGKSVDRVWSQLLTAPEVHAEFDNDESGDHLSSI